MLRDRDRLLLLGLGAMAAGFLAIGLGWLGAARKDTVPEQFPYLLSGGAAGLGAIVAGSTMLILRAFRALGVAQEPAEAVSADAERTQQLAPMVAVGASSYHDMSCHLVRGEREPEVVPLGDAIARDLSPCRVCRPLGVGNGSRKARAS